MKLYESVGDALADPASTLHRVVYVDAPKAMAFNPATPDEWTAYLAWTRDNPCGSTEAWRASLVDA